MGKVDSSVNQVDQFLSSTAEALTAGSDPGALSRAAHRAQYQNFLAALAGTEEIRVDLETNRQAIGLITGVYESARAGRPVSLI